MDRERMRRKYMMKAATAAAEMGWEAHCVPASEYDDIHANYHTHGVKENFNHLDFQVVLPVNPKQSHAVVASIIEMIKEGRIFEEGVLYDDILATYPMGFKKFTENGREVLRLMIPDSQGRHPDKPECDAFFRIQMDNYPFDDSIKEDE